MNELKEIKSCFSNDRVFYSRHARLEMINEEFGVIKEVEVYEAIQNGEIIEVYLDDRPYPSVLVFGETLSGRPLHIVVAQDIQERVAIIVTVYQPNPCLWVDYKRRLR